jgi:membrane-associated protease RseP (regulator of RpoE activity)
MTALKFLAGVLFMFVGVALSIALHEVGHLLPAKKFGVRVTQYMVGFGPTVWSRKRGETEYGVKAIPLGGYIRMIGMFPPKPGDDPKKIRVSSTGRFSQLIDEARRTSHEEVEPGDERRVFYRLPVGRKVVIMLGGPVMNLLIATVLIGGLAMVNGMATQKPGASVAAVYKCAAKFENAKAVDPATCSSGEETPAFRAGIKPDDQLLTIDGHRITSNADVSRIIRPRIDKATQVVVLRDGREVSLTVTPMRNELPVYDADGQPVVGADGKVLTEEAGFLGVSSSPLVVIERKSITAVPGIIGSGIAQTAGVILKIPQKMVDIVRTTFGGGERDLNGPISVVGVGRIAGEASAGLIPGLDTDFASVLAMLVGLLGSLNLALFVFNLVPLLPLDGGHVAGALWEGLKRGWARLRGRPDPGHVDVAKALPVAYAVSMALIVMSVLLIYADIVNPIKLGG